MQVQQIADLPGVEIVRERTRTWLAYVSVAGFFLAIMLVIVGGWMILQQKTDDVVDMLTATAGVLGGVVGAVVGFYFRGND